MKNSSKKGSLLSFSMMLPHQKIDNAGGDYVRRHYQALAPDFSIKAVGDNTPGNNLSKQQPDPSSVKVRIVPLSPWSTYFIGRVIRRISRELNPFRLDLGFTHAIRHSAEISQAIKGCDLVELQWVEYFTFASHVKRISPETKIVGVVHDVLHQRFERGLGRRGLLRLAAVRWLLVQHAIKRERKLISAIDLILVFSEKDETLVKLLQPASRTFVIPPSLETPGMHTHGETAPGKNVMFMAAFQRPENDEAALWLVNEIWPAIKLAVPDATLSLVGAGPSPRLLKAASNVPGILVTGFVDNLDAYYAHASVVVVPILSGAGLKFKTATAMLWGKPIVTSPIGAEGVAPFDHFFAVTDQATTFAAAVIELLLDPRAGEDVTARATKWAAGRYTNAAYQDAIRAVYSQAVSSV